MQTLPMFYEIAETRVAEAGPRDKNINVKVAINTARMMVEAEKNLVALKSELVELCFKSDTALRYLGHAADGLKDRGYLDGFLSEMKRRVESARAAIDKVNGVSAD
jgi:hypothetical protein